MDRCKSTARRKLRAMEESQKWRRVRDGEDERGRKSDREKMHVSEKVGKVAKHCVFPMLCGCGGSKSRLAKAAGAEPAGQFRDEKCTPLWRGAHLEVKSDKTRQVSERLLEVADVAKVHAVVARGNVCKSKSVKAHLRSRSTFGS